MLFNAKRSDTTRETRISQTETIERTKSGLTWEPLQIFRIGFQSFKDLNVPFNLGSKNSVPGHEKSFSKKVFIETNFNRFEPDLDQKVNKLNYSKPIWMKFALC